jgi:hypothetical protein
MFIFFFPFTRVCCYCFSVCFAAYSVVGVGVVVVDVYIHDQNTMTKIATRRKKETFIMASEQIKAHFTQSIVKNTDFH